MGFRVFEAVGTDDLAAVLTEFEKQGYRLAAGPTVRTTHASSVAMYTVVMHKPLPDPPQWQGSATLSGQGVVGATLTSDNGQWSNDPTSFTWDWFSNGLPAATDDHTNTYVVQPDDQGWQIYVIPTATNDGGSTVSPAPSNRITIAQTAPPVLVTAPTLSGGTTQGSTLTCSPGEWARPPSSQTYAWKVDGMAQAAPPVPNQLYCGGPGVYVCTVTATNELGSTDAPPTPPVTVT